MNTKTPYGGGRFITQGMLNEPWAEGLSASTLGDYTMSDKQAVAEINWRCVGNGILHAFTDGDEYPRIEVDCSDAVVWRFTLDNRQGSGAVMVGPGCHYNPLALIQSMWVAFETGSFAGMKANARIKFDEEISEAEWSGMFGDDMV